MYTERIIISLHNRKIRTSLQSCTITQPFAPPDATNPGIGAEGQYTTYIKHISTIFFSFHNKTCTGAVCPDKTALCLHFIDESKTTIFLSLPPEITVGEVPP
jgi:hypothetical protein